jgi:hypothetical protein
MKKIAADNNYKVFKNAQSKVHENEVTGLYDLFEDLEMRLSKQIWDQGDKLSQLFKAFNSLVERVQSIEDGAIGKQGKTTEKNYKLSKRAQEEQWELQQQVKILYGRVAECKRRLDEHDGEIQALLIATGQ